MSKNLTTTSQNKSLAHQENLKSLINSPAVRKRFEEMLGKKTAGFISSVISAVQTNKNLSECDPGSVVASAAIAASMDLPINPSLGFAHIVPYKNVAQFQMGWKGYVQLALRSGQYKAINATTVVEGQIKRMNKFTGEIEFDHEVNTVGVPVVGYLLYFKLINGYEKYFYMTYDECFAHGKKYSQSFKKGFGQWVDNFEAMALKTVVKLGLSKYGILSLEMQKAIEDDIADSPAREVVAQMAELSDFSNTNKQMDVVQVDSMPATELESQEPDPGEFIVSFGSRKNKPVKLREIPKEELIEFLKWAYTQEKLTDPIKEYVHSAESYLEKTGSVG